MREDNEHFRHHGPLLRRIIIVVAVLAAVPAILWTITFFMRSYVGPPRLPTFRQLASTATMPLPRNASVSADAAGQRPPAAEQPSPSAASTVTAAAVVTPPDTPDSGVAPKGPLLADRASAGAGAPIGGSNMTTTSSIVPSDPKAAEIFAAAAAPADGAAPNTGALVAQQPAAAQDPPADIAPAEPLSGPIPLPPRRPRLVAMAQMTPAGVPIPRPRPDAAGPGASENTTARPFDWLQNMFHKNSE